MRILEVCGLSYRYPDGRVALREISFNVDSGETLAIIGPNGAGKSTLLLHLVGLLSATTGHIEVLGMPLRSDNLKKIRRAVGLVFQDPDDQLFCPTVFDDVAFGPLNLGLSSAEVRHAVEHALEMVGMADAARRVSYHLSLGERKRIALASVLASTPSLLVLDEPSANLDPGGKWELVEMLKSLSIPKIIVTHDLELAGALATRVMVMDRGEVVALDGAEEILSARALLIAHRLARHQEKGRASA